MEAGKVSEALASRLTVLSLGAGVQSTTLALMAARGEIPAPDCAIFADTGWEPKAVYDHLDRLEAALPFPLYRVSAGNIRDSIVSRRNTTGGRFASVPWFTLDPTGKKGMGQRQCTSEFKLKPIRQKLRDLVGAVPRQRLPIDSVKVLIGISTDEVSRMKPSRDRWIKNVWPLIDAGMSRQDCVRWMEERQWKAPKSACIGCPFHSNAMWRELRDLHPAEWADAVEVDRQLRQGNARGMKAKEYMHAARVPLDEVDLSTLEERGQGNLFNMECEGMCGV
jgi:hypothetical protein